MSWLVRTLIRPQRLRDITVSIMLTLGVVFAGLLILGATPIGAVLDGQITDQRFEDRGRVAPPENVVIAGIGTNVANFTTTWPLSESVHRLALERFASDDVAGVAFDTALNSSLPYLARDGLNKQEQRNRNTHVESSEKPFLNSLSDFASVVLPIYLEDGSRSTADSSLLPFTDYSSVSREEALAQTDATQGVSWRVPAADDVIRTVPKTVEITIGERTTELETLGLSMLTTILENLPGEDAPDPAEVLAGIPESVVINWYGRPGTFEDVGYAYQFSRGTGTEVFGQGPTSNTEIADRVLFVGPVDGAPVIDEYQTPFGSMPSVEIQATIFSNLMTGSWLIEPAAWWEYFALGTLVLAIWGLLMFAPITPGVISALALLVGYWWASSYLFREEGIVVPVAMPLTVASLVFIALSLWLAIMAVRERLRVKGLFARYVSPDVVKDLVDTQDTIHLGGEKKEITVLFSDIRSFTQLSESIDPEELVTQLNEYFTEMVAIITEEEGTIDKFMGDGLMAIFGAPNKLDNHPEAACRAAVRMLERLEEVNKKRAEQGLIPFEIGIGIHSGEAVVGNIGSPLFRVDFTAIGDTVNLASRLEGSTKETGTALLVSEQTADAAGDAFKFSEQGSVVVRGRSTPTKIYSIDVQAAPADPVELGT